MTHATFNLAYGVVFRGGSDDFDWFSISEKNGFRNLDRTSHISTIKCAGEFREKPVIILLFIAKVITLFEILLIGIL